MTSRWAVIFNTDEIGGAERSLIEQFQYEKRSFSFFVPRISCEGHLLPLLRKKFLKSSVESFDIPEHLYKISRSNISFFHGVKLFFSIFSIYFSARKFAQQTESYSHFYLNGNKAAIWTLLSLSLSGTLFKKNYYWHLRDYPGIFLHLILKWMPLRLSKKVTLIANSDDVAARVGMYQFKLRKIEVLYNLSGLPILDVKISRKIKKIGIVGMFTPWKGQHQILLMAKIYEKELEELGIEQIIFFGKDIYHTKGDHQGYLKELKKLVDKMRIKKIQFIHDQSPAEIFNSIDLLIHSSIKPEPFGRVVVEAFSAGVPVLSTGLGGAGELVLDGITGGIFFPFQYGQILKLITLLKNDDQLLNKIVSGATEKSVAMEKKILNQLEKLLDDSEKESTLLEL